MPIVCVAVDYIFISCLFILFNIDHVEVIDGKVTVCRDYVKNKCGRTNCKYYHLPWSVLVRSPMIASAISSTIGNPGAGTAALSQLPGGLTSSPAVLQQ